MIPIEWLAVKRKYNVRKTGIPKVEGFENFENVKTCIVVGECLIQLLEVRIVHVFEDERGSS